jgi:adenylate cyclase class 2
MEVEVKFKLKEGVEEKIKKIARFVVEKEEVDMYFNHPCRNFRETDEALRIRIDNEGASLTYKGAKLDSETKSREEIKVKLDSFRNAMGIFTRLGFKPVAEVRKVRRIYRVGDVVICIDRVEGVGEYVEIEIEDESINAKEKLFKIAEKLGYSRHESIRESYLEMLITKKGLENF